MARFLLLLLALLASFIFFGPVRTLTLDYASSPRALPRQAERAKKCSCRCFPGDACWPKPDAWDAFNRTLGGKLIATVPIAAPCHNEAFPAYDAARCDALRNVYFFPETHLESSSSIMAPFFTNNTCNPFLPASVPCTLGYYVSYAVRASDASDYQKTIAFTNKHNIRLVIRNTGHDYNGKSTGAGAVSIWTHNMKSIELKDYRSLSFTGKAMKMSAGVEVKEAYEFADSKGVMVVGGNCPTVGMVGGYSQGGGHGPLVSKFGLAADQVLEWEVVTAAGKLLTATPDQNQDLYWALCGGGGGTYGAVVSLTAKTYPATTVSSASISFANTGHNADEFYDAVGTLVKSLPSMVDAGAVVIWLVTPQVFLVGPATAPGVSKADLDKLFQPVFDNLQGNAVPYDYMSQEYPTYLQSYNAMNAPWNVSQNQLGGRLIPRSLIEEDNESFMAALRNIVDSGIIFSGVSFNVTKGVSSPDAIGANPYWRQTLFSAVLGTPYSFTDEPANIRYQKQMTDELLPQLERLTPNGAAYLNEADFRQPDWKPVFYGSHYDRLNKIKAQYDPDGRFYALQAVGSDRWTQQLDGRLCKV